MSFAEFIKNIVLTIGIVYFSIMFAFAPVAVFVLISLSYYLYKKRDNDDAYYKLTREELDRIIYNIDKARRENDEKK